MECVSDGIQAEGRRKGGKEGEECLMDARCFKGQRVKRGRG